MKLKQLVLSLVAVGACCSGFVWADQEGTSTAQFLKIGQGARAEGMGGAFTAIANDARAVSWNPAGLAQITRRELAFDHLSFIEDINIESVATALPFNGLNGTLGAGISYVDYGSIDAMDSSGSSLGQKDVTAFSGVVSWGQALGDRLALGVGIKFINQDLADEKASGLAADLGAMYFLVPDKLSIAASALSVGQKIKTGTVKEDIPTTLRGGVAYYYRPDWVFDVDVVKENDSETKFNLGTEYIYQKVFIGRVGYQDTKESEGGLSAGVGFIWRPQSGDRGLFIGSSPEPRFNDRTMEVRFDYAYVDYGDFDSTHRIGINIAY